MLREEQIDIRRQRAKAVPFVIENLGKNRVFSDFRITNPATNGQYTVAIRGMEVGQNSCTCPDFRSNTLGTCKHIEAVLSRLEEEVPRQYLQRKATVTRPELVLIYGEVIQLRLNLPPRHSDKLRDLKARFFDDKGDWTGNENYSALIETIESVPEQVTVMSDALEFMNREIDRLAMQQREQEIIAQLDLGEMPPVLENLLRVPLYDYQLRGAVFAAFRGRSILGDDMGLGKTVQTLAAVEILARERGVRHVLVIAPSSVKYQWESEIRKFTARDVLVIDGGKDERQDQYLQPAFYRLLNYEQVVRDGDLINDCKPDLIVLDEAQRIKNWESKTSRAVKKLRSPYALVLTGTPIENKLEELYSIVQFVDDRRLGPAFQFLSDHRILDEEGHLKGYQHLDRIREKLAPILLRRTRSEVLKQLPQRTESMIYTELAPEQRLPYEEQRANLARLLQKSYLTDLDRKRILACIVNLRMLCNSTYLFDKVTNVSPKLDEFAEWMTELMIEGEHKAVVFSQWEVMLVKAAEVLDRLGIGYTTLHGGIPSPDRRALIEQFRTDDNCRVFLSTDAGGVGLNLQNADTVINLELPWNPAVLDQRIARVHRLGQERPVRVINFITRDTIEERVLKAIEAKRGLFESVMEDGADEISFQSVSQSTFLNSMRDMIGLQPEVEVATPSIMPHVPINPTTIPPLPTLQPLLHSTIQWWEVLADWLAQLPSGSIDADTWHQGQATLTRCQQLWVKQTPKS